MFERGVYSSGVHLHSSRVTSESLKLIWPEGATPEASDVYVCTYVSNFCVCVNFF